jgi:hypothetical protein
MGVRYSSSALEEGNAVAVDYVDEISVTNTDAAAYLQIFLGEATLPADTAVPDICIAVDASASVSYNPEGTRLSTGGNVAFCLSSTAATKTVVGDVGFFWVR